MMTSETVNPSEAAATGSPRHEAGRKSSGRKGGLFGRIEHPRRIQTGLGILILLALVVFGYWFFFSRGIVFSDDARFNGHMVDMAPTVGGRVIALLVKEGDKVRLCDQLFELSTGVPSAVVTQCEASVRSAQAGLTVAKARFERAQNGPRPEEIGAAEATVRRLQSDEALAQIELARIQGLRKEGAGTPDQLDRAAAAYESAKHSRDAAAQDLALLREGPRADDLEVAKADVQLAQSRVAEQEAALAKAHRDLDLYSVKARCDGYVVRRWVDPGAVVQAGQPVVSVFDPSTLRVDANIEEKYLGRVAVGDDVDIRVDAYPRLRLTGRVTDVLRAVNSEFSLVPAEGVSGTFIKVTQRVPLRISVSAPPDLALGPGLSVVIRVRSGTADRNTRGGPAAP